MSIYSRLYKYQENENRSKLENFLTEALADLLSRDATLARKFIFDVLLKDNCPKNTGAKREALAKKLANAEKLEWRTQKALGGISEKPDISVFANDSDKPIILLENKINAGFTHSHTLAVTSEEGIKQEYDQLQKYGQWLTKKVPDGALVFLTHHTLVPEGFLTHSKYGSTIRSFCYWRSVYAWLEEARQGSPGFVGIVNDLIGEFSHFLSERRMTDLNRGDLDTLSPFLSKDLYGKLEELTDFIRKQIDLLPEFSDYTWWSKPLSRGHFAERGLRDGAKHPTLGSTTIEWGLAADDNADFFQQVSPGVGLQFFVYVQRPSGGFSALDEKRFGAWKLLGQGGGYEWRGQTETADQFLSGGSFTESVFAWLKPKIKDALEMLKVLSTVG
ncbi:MAG TPA: hypothetical protein VKS22_04955 [Candidatus Binataceae bacterium]|nr:hypothetical protein [Candidatus Binataceae bacterium]